MPSLLDVLTKDARTPHVNIEIVYEAGEALPFRLSVVASDDMFGRRYATFDQAASAVSEQLLDPRDFIGTRFQDTVKRAQRMPKWEPGPVDNRADPFPAPAPEARPRPNPFDPGLAARFDRSQFERTR